MKKRLAIITTHPIQYNAPFFNLLEQSNIVQPKIFYTWGDAVLQSKYDPGFNTTIEWDIPLLEGYEYEFPENVAKDKGSHHFNGIINPGMIRTIEAWQPDAILVYGWKFQSHLSAIRNFKGKIPVWFRGDSTLLDEKPGVKNSIKTLLLKWVYGHTDLAFYTGTNNKNYFLKYGINDRQLVKASHAVDNERFANTHGRYTTEAATLKKKLNIDKDAPVFLFAGKLSPKKGVGTLFEAFKLMAKQNAHLLVIGNGEMESELKAKYGREAAVTFLDFQNQQLMPVIYCLGDVFVLPSVGPGESWGLAINEAMAAGKPVIASDKCGGAIDLITNGKNGYVVAAGNPGDLALKMTTMLEMKNDWDKFGAYSLEVISKYTFMEFVKALEKSITGG